jgi:integrase/recombinase XerD
MTERAISPLRRRMIEDMTIRKFAQKTQHDYVQRVKEFASYLKRSPIQPNRKVYAAFGCI